jgi:chorismate mutase
VALLVRRHMQLLEPDERSRLAKIVAKSKGRPRKNLSANEREEMLRLVRKLEPSQFGRNAFTQVRGGLGRKK